MSIAPHYTNSVNYNRPPYMNSVNYMLIAPLYELRQLYINRPYTRTLSIIIAPLHEFSTTCQSSPLHELRQFHINRPPYTNSIHYNRPPYMNSVNYMSIAPLT